MGSNRRIAATVRGGVLNPRDAAFTWVVRHATAAKLEKPPPSKYEALIDWGNEQLHQLQLVRSTSSTASAHKLGLAMDPRA